MFVVLLMPETGHMEARWDVSRLLVGGLLGRVTSPRSVVLRADELGVASVDQQSLAAFLFTSV